MSKTQHNWRIAVVAMLVYALDQVTKVVVLRVFDLDYHDQKVVIDGFFNLVHWGNTGAAWSMFQGRNTLLTLIGLLALVLLILTRHHFDVHTLSGQISLGLILGGILGNITDRIRVNHVIDFLYFYVMRRDGQEAGFPAFNVADMAICSGVSLLFLMSFRADLKQEPAPAKDKS